MRRPYDDLDAPPSIGCLAAMVLGVLAAGVGIGAAIRTMIVSAGDSPGTLTLIIVGLLALALYVLWAAARLRRVSRRRPAVDLARTAESLQRDAPPADDAGERAPAAADSDASPPTPSPSGPIPEPPAPSPDPSSPAAE